MKINQLDAHVFDKTVEEIKYRYYEVARALLKFRNQEKHRYFDYEEYDIERETCRKNNWERILMRTVE